MEIKNAPSLQPVAAAAVAAPIEGQQQAQRAAKKPHRNATKRLHHRLKGIDPAYLKDPNAVNILVHRAGAQMQRGPSTAMAPDPRYCANSAPSGQTVGPARFEDSATDPLDRWVANGRKWLMSLFS